MAGEEARALCDAPPPPEQHPASLRRARRGHGHGRRGRSAAQQRPPTALQDVSSGGWLFAWRTLVPRACTHGVPGQTLTAAAPTNRRQLPPPSLWWHAPMPYDAWSALWAYPLAIFRRTTPATGDLALRARVPGPLDAPGTTSSRSATQGPCGQRAARPRRPAGGRPQPRWLPFCLRCQLRAPAPLAILCSMRACMGQALTRRSPIARWFCGDQRPCDLSPPAAPAAPAHHPAAAAA